MRLTLQMLVVGAAAVAGATTPASAESMEGHKIVPVQEIKWGPGPPSIPPGAEAAILYGDPAKEGLFALRLKLPKGYHIAPHTHPKPEVVTVISGAIRFGMGETADRARLSRWRQAACSRVRPVWPILSTLTRRRSSSSTATGRGALPTSTPRTIRARGSSSSTNF